MRRSARLSIWASMRTTTPLGVTSPISPSGRGGAADVHGGYTAAGAGWATTCCGGAGSVSTFANLGVARVMIEVYTLRSSRRHV